MSSILKALQKLEQERAARSGGPPDISAEILKRERAGKAAPRWRLPTAMTVVAAMAVLATYTVMGGFSARKAGITPNTTPLAPRTTPTGQAPAGSTGGTTAPAPSLPPVEIVRDIPVASRTVTRQTSLTSKPAPQLTKPAPAGQQHATVEPAKEKAPPAPAKPSRPTLSVGGIAWQQNNSLRLAVVNGMSVSEGAIVEGARVEEILPDRIRFSFRNEHFDVPLEK